MQALLTLFVFSTPEHAMRVDPSSIFSRFVLEGKGYGSYCYGQNGILLGVLRRLGYRYYCLGFSWVFTYADMNVSVYSQYPGG